MLELLSALLVGCLISGVIPLVNAELLVAGAAVAAPTTALPLIVGVATVGQMATKTGLFELARHAPRRLPGRARQALERATKRLEAHPGAAGSLVFASAVAGIPPFYGVSLAGGALGMRTRIFLVTGTAGRALRFGALAWTAHLVANAGGTP